MRYLTITLALLWCALDAPAQQAVNVRGRGNVVNVASSGLNAGAVARAGVGARAVSVGHVNAFAGVHNVGYGRGFNTFGYGNSFAYSRGFGYGGYSNFGVGSYSYAAPLAYSYAPAVSYAYAVQEPVPVQAYALPAPQPAIVEETIERRTYAVPAATAYRTFGLCR